MPSGVPSPVIPNQAKVDLAHLKADIPKYAAAAGFGATTTEWWHSFVTSLENSMRQQQCMSTTRPCIWLYQELLDLAKNGVRTTRSLLSLPTQLINMRAVETNALPQVCVYTQLQRLMTHRLKSSSCGCSIQCTLNVLS